MRMVVLSVSVLLIGTALLNIGGGLLGTTLSLRMAISEFAALTAGLVMSAFFIGYILGVFYAYRLIVGVGYIRAFAALASILSAATLIHPFWVDPFLWSALRIVQGFCLAGLAVCTESWLNERSTNDIRGQILSFYMIAVYLAQGGGQLLLNVDDPSGFALFVVASVALSLALVPVAMTRVQPPTPDQPARLGLIELYRISPVGVMGATAAGGILGAFHGMAPFFTDRVGLNISETSHFMSLAILGGLLLQWPLGRLSDRVDRRAVIAGIALGIVLASLAIAVLAHERLEWMVLVAPLLGGMIFTLYPLSAAHTNDYVDAARFVPASGGLILSYGLGAILGPALGAAMMGAFGPSGLFVFIAGLGGAMGSFALWRMTRRAAPPVEDREPHQVVAPTTSVAVELDPRAEPSTPDGEMAEDDADADQPA